MNGWSHIQKWRTEEQRVPALRQGRAPVSKTLMEPLELSQDVELLLLSGRERGEAWGGGRRRGRSGGGNGGSGSRGGFVKEGEGCFLGSGDTATPRSREPSSRWESHVLVLADGGSMSHTLAVVAA